MNKGYEFIDTKGEHLHTLDGKPLIGTSTVLSIVAKPLTWWAAGEAVKTLGWTPAKIIVDGKYHSTKKEDRIVTAFNAWDKICGAVEDTGLPIEDGDANRVVIGEHWLEFLDTAYAAHSKSLTKSASKGTNLHAVLEKYVKYCIEKNEGKPVKVESPEIQGFILWSLDNVANFVSSEAHHYSEKYWLGGISDAICVLKGGGTAIIDFKSSKAAYNNQFWQIAGYAIELAENGAFDSKGERFIEPMSVDAYIVIPFGAETFSPSIKYDTEGLCKDAFLAALTLYKANQIME